MHLNVDRVLVFVFSAISVHHIFLLTITILYQNLENFQVEAQMYFACTKAYCTAYGHCPEFSCRGKNKIVLHNVTQCGCCHRCVEEKDEGEECPLDITGNLPGNQCGPHLKCISSNSKYGKCSKIMDKECEKERLVFEHSSSQLITSKAKPECDQFGEFIPKRCKNGTICQCVNEKGNEIFGIAPYNEAKEMNCLCSRQFELVKSKLKEVGSKPIEPINFMRCKENGNYESYQTHLQYSYCIHPSNGTMWDRPVVRGSEKDLPCVNNRYSFKTNCIKKYNEAMKNITEKGKNYLVVGFDLPNCDLDGTYAPVQCLNDKCFCVDKNGKKLIGSKKKPLEVYRNDPFAEKQKCTCARHIEKIRVIKGRYRNKVTELFSRYQCDKNGNYLPIQCSDSACYCVNQETGYADFSNQPGELSSALKSEPEQIVQLFCYINYPYEEKSRLRDLLRLPAYLTDNKQTFM